jgi:site-specific DNA recombinase
MRCAIHARRSTDEHQAASLEVQLSEAKRFVEARGWTWSEEHIYIEDAVSRAEFKKRPQLLKLLNAAESGAFDIAITRDETRLGGDMVRTCLLIQDLLDAGIQLFYYFTGEQVRLDDATAKFMVAARTFAAELEREKISQRTHEHLKTKARRGLNVGGRVFGYDNIERHEGDRRVHVEYAINEEQAEVVRGMFAAYGSSHGLRSIAKDLNERGIAPPRAGKRGTRSWSTSAIHAMLRRERYRGVIVWNQREKTYRKGTKVRIQRDADDWIRVDVPELRIVSDELWFAVQQRIGANTSEGRPKGGRPFRYLLAGVARCAECGGPMTVINGRFDGEMAKAYTCAYHHDRGVSVCGSNTRRPVAALNGAVVDWLHANVLSEEVVLAALRQVRERLAQRSTVTSAELPALQTEAERLRSEIGRLVAAIATGGSQPRALVEAVTERQERLSALEARVRAAQAAPGAIDLEVHRLEREARARIAELRDAFGRNPDEARAFMRSVFDGPITCTPIETSAGKRFQIEGSAVIGRFFLRPKPVSVTLRPQGDSNPCYSLERAVSWAGLDDGDLAFRAAEHNPWGGLRQPNSESFAGGVLIVGVAGASPWFEAICRAMGAGLLVNQLLDQVLAGDVERA